MQDHLGDISMNDLLDRNDIHAWRMEQEWFDQSHQDEPADLPLVWRIVSRIADWVEKMWRRG